MTDNATICYNCSERTGRITRFKPLKNGVVIPYAAFGSYRHADLWECRGCGHRILRGFGNIIESHTESAAYFLNGKSRILREVVDQ